MTSLSLRGVFPPIPTPFDNRGDVAYGALAENLERWNQFDLTGYVVLGSNGEAVYLTDDEKVHVLETCRQAIPAGKLLLAGTGAQSTRQTIALTRRAADAGADAALIVTPHYYSGKMTGEALVRHYQAVAEAVPIPVLIYNVPKFTGVDMEAAAIARASQHPGIIGTKDTAGNIAKLADTVRLVSPDFQVLAGSAGFFLAGLTVGAVGGILALANIAPRQSIDLYRLFQAGQIGQAAELQRRMLPVNAAVTATLGIPGLKAALDLLGYYGGPVRPPMLDITAAQREELRAILVQGGVI
jgi:4-hydroxy-2-oxoglutarate aldolase